MSKIVTNSQFGMFEFCHILAFLHPYEFRNIVVNLKIFESRFHKNGDRQKELKFHLESGCHCFWVSPLRRNASRFFKNVIAKVFRMELAVISRDFP